MTAIKPTSDHQRNNDLVVLNYLRSRPSLFATLWNSSNETEQEAIRERLRRAGANDRDFAQLATLG